MVSDLDTLYPFVGPPLEDSFIEFYNFSKEDAHRAVEIYHDRYERIGVYENAPYDGAAECLHQLREMGYILALATSKPIDMTDVVLDRFGLRRYFDFIGARDNEGLMHTKADVIDHVTASLGIKDKSEAVMIGDRKYDIQGAKATGLDSIGVLFGYGSRDELLTAGADHLAEDYDSLLRLLSDTH